MTEVIIIDRGLELYEKTHQAMKDQLALLKGGKRTELWCVQHLPVFTQGQAGKAKHVLNPGDIPVIQSDRGGEVTYHGPGQVILYTLIPMKHFTLNVRALVSLLENIVIGLLESYGISSLAHADAPGVYVGNRKIASLGLRIRHGVSYHGVALNVSMDLEPFSRINPCGYEGLEVTQLSDYISTVAIDHVFDQLSRRLKQQLLDLASHRMASQNQQNILDH
ncbi:MAG: lipoyl(octanoyl) transferase LipB [Litorivicinaceae bacterium]|nr:octanoyltransferase [Gammaproteobacteria bacterium]RPG21893.1 MAG: lipoyl(octanoyl) transferase LipB [Oceanospirillales bacterium TMED33]RZO78011.1 MAG: lipoyl(octanoyl) transferase LipB [Litorivicinaceae bacterium]